MRLCGKRKADKLVLSHLRSQGRSSIVTLKRLNSPILVILLTRHSSNLMVS